MLFIQRQMFQIVKAATVRHFVTIATREETPLPSEFTTGIIDLFMELRLEPIPHYVENAMKPNHSVTHVI